MIKKSDIVLLITRPVPTYKPPMTPLSVIFQDDDILVLDKPTGLLTVSGKAPGTHDCLESRAVDHHPGAQITHRLDWDTSGLIVFALNNETRRQMGINFEKRLIEKHYVARVWGVPNNQNGTINLPMRCDWPNRPRQIVDHDNGREAITDWEVQKTSGDTAYLLLKPRTGRSHQLRVHCLSMGHPILADRLYAHEKAYHAHERMCLHATYLAFDHPINGKKMRFECPQPF